MNVQFDTRSIAHSDREETIREAIWGNVVRVEIAHHPDSHQIAATGVISSLGRIQLCSVKSNATTIRRTPKLARDDLEPSVFLGLQLTGNSIVAQHGREAMLSPGDMAVYDTTRPYTLLNEGGIHQHYYRFARSDLALPERTINEISAVRLGAGNPLAPLAAGYFRRLAGLQDPPVATGYTAAVAGPSIELLRALIATSLRDDPLAADPLENTCELRILAFMRAHLADYDLSAARIAAEHHISVRQLYKVLARIHTTPADWIRAHRLEACRADLTKPTMRRLTIEAIARRWGLTDPTHFSRAFKDAYGITPRDWRERNQPPWSELRPRPSSSVTSTTRRRNDTSGRTRTYT
jgi:AraC-like DNA-binding protein